MLPVSLSLRPDLFLESWLVVFCILNFFSGVGRGGRVGSDAVLFLPLGDFR